VSSLSAFFSSLVARPNAAFGIAFVLLSLAIGFWLDRRAAARRTPGREDKQPRVRVAVVEIIGGLVSGALFLLGAVILYARIVGHLTPG
jgi:hypothetical protein